MSVFVVRAFIRLREMVSTHKELADKLLELERTLEIHDTEIQLLVKAIRQFMAQPPPSRKKISFQLRERRAMYGKK
jgi:hypothetical protein